MAASSETLMNFRGLKLRDAYNYTRQEIDQFMDDVVTTPANFLQKGTSEAEVQKIGGILKNVRDQIRRLSVGHLGVEYHDPNERNLDPSQHIRRKRDPQWKAEWDGDDVDNNTLTVSKFTTDPQRHPKFKGHLALEQHGVKKYDINYWNPYDLLGLFLSMLGPAPPAANRRWFYLPLTAVYGRWCQKLADTGVQKWNPIPHMLQCTWVRRSDCLDDFFLGASLGGYNFYQTGRWPMNLRTARFDLVRDILHAPSTMATQWDVDYSIQRTGTIQKAEKTLVVLDQAVGLLISLPETEDKMQQEEAQRLIREIRRIFSEKENKRTIINFGELVNGFLSRWKDSPFNRDPDAKKPPPTPTVAQTDECKAMVGELYEYIYEKLADPGTRFGNCAESYPFVNLLLENQLEDIDKSQGLALPTKSLSAENYEDWQTGRFWKNLEQPCQNCSYLLAQLGYTKDVRKGFGKDGNGEKKDAPTKPPAKPPIAPPP